MWQCPSGTWHHKQSDISQHYRATQNTLTFEKYHQIIRRHDLSNKKTNTKIMTKTIRKHFQRAIFDNCDQEYVKCEWRVTDPSQMLLAFFWKLPHKANPYRSGHGRCDWPSGSKESPFEVLIITEGKLEKDWGLQKTWNMNWCTMCNLPFHSIPSTIRIRRLCLIYFPIVRHS